MEACTAQTQLTNSRRSLKNLRVNFCGNVLAQETPGLAIKFTEAETSQLA
jgi:hypothetical protein